MVLIRSIFRIIEFEAGHNGPIATNEHYMYVFDFALLCVAWISLLVFHPGVLLKVEVLPEMEFATKNIKAELV